MKHDELCRGCERIRRSEINKIDVRFYPDYETQRSQCGIQIEGLSEHFVKGQNLLCQMCAG